MHHQHVVLADATVNVEYVQDVLQRFCTGDLLQMQTGELRHVENGRIDRETDFEFGRQDPEELPDARVLHADADALAVHRAVVGNQALHQRNGRSLFDPFEELGTGAGQFARAVGNACADGCFLDGVAFAELPDRSLP